jgi:hypothetical protein
MAADKEPRTLVPQDSPLRRIPSAVDARTVLFVDGVRYSIEILELSYYRLTATLENIVALGDIVDQLAPRIVEAISDSWTIVDSAHRLRELVQQVPGLKQNDSNLQTFLRSTEAVERLRHFVQHLRSGIDSFVSRRMPLWGTVSWSRIDPASHLPENHIIIPGTFYKGVSAHGCTFDREKWSFVERIVLHAGSARVDLAAVFERVAAFSVWFQRWFEAANGTGEREGSDTHVAITVSPSPQDHVTDPTPASSQSSPTCPLTSPCG